jgi:hypothetical protein
VSLSRELKKKKRERGVGEKEYVIKRRGRVGKKKKQSFCAIG